MSFETDAIAGEKITLVELYKITLADGTIKYWTPKEKGYDVTVGANTYSAIPLVSPPVKRTSGIAIQEKQVSVPRHADYVDVTKLISRYLDNSTIEFQQADRNSLSDIRTAFKGRAAEVSYNTHGVTINFKDHFNFARRMVPKEDYQASCPYRIYSAITTLQHACGLSQSAFSATGTADSGTATTIADSARNEATDYWNFGYVEITAGPHSGEKREIIDYSPGTITTLVPFTSAIAATDQYTCYPHCQKRFDLCRDRFANQLNFGGMLHIPRPEESLI